MKLVDYTDRYIQSLDSSISTGKSGFVAWSFWQLGIFFKRQLEEPYERRPVVEVQDQAKSGPDLQLRGCRSSEHDSTKLQWARSL